MFKRIALFGLILLLLGSMPASSMARTAAATASDAQPDAASARPLSGMLNSIQADAFDGFLSYADIDVFLRLAGVPRPETGVFPEAGTEAYAALARAFRLVAVGPHAFWQQLLRPEAFAAANGFNWLDTSQVIEAARFPAIQIWLQGTFNAASIRTALEAKAYEAHAIESDQFALMAPDGKLDIGYEVDLAERDAAFLFGGDLGRRWPVLISETLLGSSPDGAMFETAVSGGDTLADLPELSGAIAAAEAVLNEPIAQMQFMSNEASGVWADLEADAHPAAAFAHYALISAYDEGAERVLMIFSYADQAAAKQAQGRIEKNVEQARLKSSNRLFADMIEAIDGKPEAAQIREGEDGTFFLIVPFRFAAISETDDLAFRSSAFTHFVQLLLKRELYVLLQ